jgi:hypothetical protein
MIRGASKHDPRGLCCHEVLISRCFLLGRTPRWDTELDISYGKGLRNSSLFKLSMKQTALYLSLLASTTK